MRRTACVIPSLLLHDRYAFLIQISQHTCMQPFHIWQRVFVVISIFSLLIITYATILVTHFQTPERTADFLKKSNAYYYIAEIVKTSIRNHYQPKLRENVVELTIADAILNAIVTPNIVQRIALPALQLRAKIAQLPISFVENNLVLDTAIYAQQFTDTIESLQLPPAVTDAGKKLIAAIPSQITLVDVTKNPNSILVTITRTRMLFENIQKILTVITVIFVVSLAGLIVINLRFLKRLAFGLFILFLVSSIVILLASFAIPLLASSVSYSPDPVTGALKDAMWDNIIWYYFSLTQSAGILYLCLAAGFYLLYRFVPFHRFDQWIYAQQQVQPAAAPSQQRKKQKQKPPSSRKK